jgi:hypothetical protein
MELEKSFQVTSPTWTRLAGRVSEPRQGKVGDFSDFRVSWLSPRRLGLDTGPSSITSEPSELHHPGEWFHH